MPETITLYRSGTLQIDYIPATVPATALAFTFYSWAPPGQQSLSGNGYGGEFLLRSGFDVIAFKTTRNDWYQGVEQSVFEAIAAFLPAASLQALPRVGYGSSMGGYAAVQFSARLGLSRVLALSPQFEIDQFYDTRWSREARETAFPYRIGADCIAPGCRYVLVYDPEDLDRLHMEKFRAVIPALQLQEVPLRWSGHPVSYFLAETGAIKDFALNMLSDDGNPPRLSSRRRHSSKTYLVNLSKNALARGKARAALVAINAGLRLDPSYSEGYRIKSLALDQMGCGAESVDAARQAVRFATHGAHERAHLSALLAKTGELGEALEMIESAIAIEGAAHFHRHHSGLLLQRGTLPEALAAAQRAVDLNPADTGNRTHLEQIAAMRLPSKLL